MATDASAPPTPLGIPKFDTSTDAPSGLGSNAQMDAIDGLIASTRTTANAAQAAATAAQTAANSKASLALVIALGG